MAGKKIAESDAEGARHYLHEVRARLDAGTAEVADHRQALEAMLLLPETEAARWLEEFRQRFAALPRNREPSRSVRSSQPAMAHARAR